MGQISFVKAKAHRDDINNNIADKLANEGQVSGRVLDLSTLVEPAGWVDMAPVLCHQPLDYLTRLVVWANIPAPTSTLKFGRFLDRWTVTIGMLFDKVLDPRSHVSRVWSLTIPEGLKEVLWKEMNGAQVIGHRYHGRRSAKSDMGRVCTCGLEMLLGHILLGCRTYNLQPLITVLLESLQVVSPRSTFRTLHPDKWGSSPWYPLLALRTLEETALPIFKGRKKVLKELRSSRCEQEWIIGNYYWMLWKWRMKEIHDNNFKFMPFLCTTPLREALKMPSPSTGEAGPKRDPGHTLAPKAKLTDGAYE